MWLAESTYDFVFKLRYARSFLQDLGCLHNTELGSETGFSVPSFINKITTKQDSKFIHPKYYKYLKEDAHIWAGKNGLILGRLACTSNKSLKSLTMWFSIQSKIYFHSQILKEITIWFKPWSIEPKYKVSV